MMQRPSFSCFAWVALLAAAAAVPPLQAVPLGTAFTYQGSLEHDQLPAHGLYDFRFSLFVQEFGGAEIASVVLPGVSVDHGLFTVDLDFGPLAWEDTALWLSVEVRADSSVKYDLLAGRQRIRPSPVALRALGVGEDSVGSIEAIESEIQNRVTGQCAAGSSIRKINQSGTVVCESDGGDGWGISGATSFTLSDVGINTTNAGATLHVVDSGTTAPAILVQGASASEGDIAWPQGEVLQLGSWDAASGTFDRAVSIDGAGLVTLDERMAFDNVPGDKISLFGNRFGLASMYGFGAQDGALYYKSNQTHAWYVGDADVSVSAPSMYLEQSALGIGTTNVDGYRLSVNGSIRAKEIVVETGWSDYVFEDDYELRTLSEVAEFIEEKGHLPDVPSAAEVAAHGVALGEMDSTLLRKIEELTLYVLELNETLRELRAKLDREAVQ